MSKLKLVFVRNEWKTKRNPNGDENKKIGIHFPDGFLESELLSKDLLLYQHIPLTKKGASVLYIRPNGAISKTAPETKHDTEVVTGTTKKDIVFQLAQEGIRQLKESTDSKKEKLIEFLTTQEQLDRNDTETYVEVSLDFYVNLTELHNELNTKRKADLLYWLARIAFDSI